MNAPIPRQWLERGTKASAGYQSVGTVRKYQGGWQPPAKYPPYVSKNQSEYGHYLVVIPNNEVHGKTGQLQRGAPGVGQYMADREKKA